MAKSKAKSEDHTELLSKLRSSIAVLLEENINAILANARTDNVAKATIAVKINGVDAAPQYFLKLRWTKGFSASSEGSVEDPKQPELLPKDEDPD